MSHNPEDELIQRTSHNYKVAHEALDKESKANKKKEIAKKMSRKEKKWNRKMKEDQGKAFGKSFNYEYGQDKSKKIAEGKVAAQRFNKNI